MRSLGLFGSLLLPLRTFCLGALNERPPGAGHQPQKGKSPDGQETGYQDPLCVLHILDPGQDPGPTTSPGLIRPVVIIKRLFSCRKSLSYMLKGW